MLLTIPISFFYTNYFYKIHSRFRSPKN